MYDNAKVKERVFFINDETVQFNSMTLTEMKQYYKSFYGTFSEELWQKLYSALNLPLKKRLNTFSKGMKRQAAVICGIACRTPYLFLDEAFDGLDPTMRIIVKQMLIDAMVDSKLTVIFSSHNLGEIDEFCDRVGLLHGGKVVFDRELDSVKGSVFKIQTSFPEPVTKEQLSADGVDILHVEENGSVMHIIARGDRERSERWWKSTPRSCTMKSRFRWRRYLFTKWRCSAMTAQNSANKSVFYKFLPYYLNKVKYLRPQLIMSIIFSVLSYPAFMLIINILCPVERELLELSQYISDPTPEQYEMNMALLDKRSLLYSLLIAEIIIGVLCLVGLFIFTFVTTLRSFRCLHNKSVVDMDMSLPINHNTRFFGDLAAVFTVNILPHFIAILLAQILLQFADLSAFDTQGETQAIVDAMMGPMAFTGLFMCIMEIAITLLLISFCGRLAEACIYPILINFAIPVIHLMTINLVESGVYGAVLYPSAISTAVGSAYPITASSPLGMMIMTLYSMMSIGCKGSVSDCGPIFRPEFGIPALLVTLACFAGAYFLIKYRRAERVGMPYVYKGMGLVIPGIVIFAITVPVSYFISINVRGQEDTMDYYSFTQNNIPGMIIGTIISTFICISSWSLSAGGISGSSGFPWQNGRGLSLRAR